jgi:phosphate starvation-inducible protein PhoH
MKTFFLNPAFLLLSNIGMNQGFYRPVATNHHLYGIESNKCESRWLSDTFLSGSKKHKTEFSNINEHSFEDAMQNKDHSNQKRKPNSFQPRTPNQISFLNLMRNDTVDIIIAIGPAGTGKTMLACYAAVEALRLGKVNKIVITRPIVSVDEEIGFLPGDIESKMDPWTRPIFDVLRETYSAKEISRMTEDGVVEIVPIGFMRGRTFKNTWIIADEMQNSSPNQMFMLATRIGEGSKMIITGDLNQSDLNKNNNGLLQIYNKVCLAEKTTGLNCVRYVELEKSDVQRSRAAKTILDIYEPDIDTPFTLENTMSSTPVQSITNENILHKYNEYDINLYMNQYNDESVDSLYSNEFEYLNQTVNDVAHYEDISLPSSKSEPDEESTIVDSTVSENKVPQHFTFNEVEYADNTNTVSSENESEWIDIDNDAALIPLRHIQKLPEHWRK